MPTTVHSDLKRRLAKVLDHVCFMAIVLGSYEELNVAAGQIETSQSALIGARNLRLICLRMLLIAAASVFARTPREDDISFRFFDDALADERLRLECAQETNLSPGAIDGEYREFTTALKACIPLYDSIKSMRDKQLAHLSREDPAPTIVGDVLNLARAAIEMAENLEYIFEGRKAYIDPLAQNAGQNVRALMRSDRPRR